MCGALPPTLNGTLKYCNNMEYWNIRILGKWNIGHLGAWSPGSWESEILGFWGPEACEPGGLPFLLKPSESILCLSARLLATTPSPHSRYYICLLYTSPSPRDS